MKATILVLANRTAASEGLLAAMRDRAAERPARFELVLPPERPGDSARRDAERRLAEALDQAREGGLEASGRVGGDCDPLWCARDAYEPARHDEILISTLPASVSHWLQVDLPARVARATGALVSHVCVREPRPPARVVHLEPRERARDVLAPLRALGWGPRGEPRTGSRG